MNTKKMRLELGLLISGLLTAAPVLAIGTPGPSLNTPTVGIEDDLAAEQVKSAYLYSHIKPLYLQLDQFAKTGDRKVVEVPPSKFNQPEFPAGYAGAYTGACVWDEGLAAQGPHKPVHTFAVERFTLQQVPSNQSIEKMDLFVKFEESEIPVKMAEFQRLLEIEYHEEHPYNPDLRVSDCIPHALVDGFRILDHETGVGASDDVKRDTINSKSAEKVNFAKIAVTGNPFDRNDHRLLLELTSNMRAFPQHVAHGYEPAFRCIFQKMQ